MGVSAPFPGLLGRACREEGLAALYTEHAAMDCLELGFAAPGVDEVAFVPDLIDVLRRTAATASVRPSERPVLVAFHVGITRVEGDYLRGSAVARIVRVIHGLSTAVAARPLHAGGFAVGVTAGLFDDLCFECESFAGQGPQAWTPMGAAEAWCRTFAQDTSAVPSHPESAP